MRLSSTRLIDPLRVRLSLSSLLLLDALTKRRGLKSSSFNRNSKVISIPGREKYYRTYDARKREREKEKEEQLKKQRRGPRREREICKREIKGLQNAKSPVLNGPSRPIKKVASLKRSDDVEKRATPSPLLSPPLLTPPRFGRQPAEHPCVTGVLS